MASEPIVKLSLFEILQRVKMKEFIQRGTDQSLFNSYLTEMEQSSDVLDMNAWLTLYSD